MQINIGQHGGIQSRGGKLPEGGTVIDFQNLKKKSKFIDSNGNEIDPVTKQIIRHKEQEPIDPTTSNEGLLHR
jgi:hypothetical protein